MSYQNLFNLTDDFIYLNSGSMGLTPRSVLQAQAQFKSELERNPTEGLFTAWPKMWKAQQDLAEFLNSRPQDLFLRPNVTYAMNDFLMALELPEGSEILTTDVEYGAIVNICQHKAKLGNHQLKFVRGDENFLQTLREQVTDRTKLLVLSHVTTGSGFVFPIEQIAQFCRERGIFFAVDGAHGAGSMPLDFSKTAVDFYGSNLHKWMMGPKGTGFGWVAPQVRPHLKPRFAGWTSYDVPAHFKTFGEGDEWTQRWMICSTVNFSDFYAISAAVDFWKQLGPKVIWHCQKHLRDLTAEQISAHTGWTCLSETADLKARGPMCAFILPERLAQRGFELMFYLAKSHRLQVSMTYIRGAWCLRLAPHIYNTEKEILRTAEILKTL